MIRNLKVLGLALVAVSALFAVSASGASAQAIAHFTSSEYPSSVTGSQEGTHEYVTGGGTIKCTTAHFKGRSIEKATTSLTVDPEYSGCVLHNSLLGETTNATIFFNECYYTFTVTEVVEEPHKWKGEVHLECPAGKSIIIQTYKPLGAGETTKENHENPLKLHCEYTVGAQTVKGISYEVTTVEGKKTYVDVNASEASTSLKRLKGGFFDCGPENQTAKYSGKTKTETLNSKGEMIEGHIGTTTT